MERSAQNRRPRQVEFCSSSQLIPCVGTMRLRKPLNWIVWDSDSKFWMFSSKTASRYQLWRRHQKFYFLWFHTCQYIFGHGFFLVLFLPLSGGIVHTNSKLLRKNRADSHSEWFGARIRCFEASALKCMVSLPFSFFRIPQLKAPILVNTGWPVSLNRSTISVAVESHVPPSVYHFFSSPGQRHDQCPCENPFAYSLTFSEFEIQIASFPVFVQSMSLNIDMEMIPTVNFSRFNVPLSWIILDLLKNLQWRKSGNRARKEAILMTTCDHALVQWKMSSIETARGSHVRPLSPRCSNNDSRGHWAATFFASASHRRHGLCAVNKWEREERAFLNSLPVVACRP